MSPHFFEPLLSPFHPPQRQTFPHGLAPLPNTTYNCRAEQYWDSHHFSESGGPTGNSDTKNGDCPYFQGTAYLAHRKAYYGEKDSGLEEVSAAIERIRQAFDGLFMNWKVERSLASDRQMFTLHFLIRREKLGLFRSSFGRLQEENPSKLLMTGPWPPYNFVPLTREEG